MGDRHKARSVNSIAKMQRCVSIREASEASEIEGRSEDGMTCM